MKMTRKQSIRVAILSILCVAVMSIPSANANVTSPGFRYYYQQPGHSGYFHRYHPYYSHSLYYHHQRYGYYHPYRYHYRHYNRPYSRWRGRGITYPVTRHDHGPYKTYGGRWVASRDGYLPRRSASDMCRVFHRKHYHYGIVDGGGCLLKHGKKWKTYRNYRVMVR